MKNLFSLVFVLVFFNNDCFSQIKLSNFYVGFSVKNKWDCYETKQSALFLGNNPFNYRTSWSDASKYSELFYKFTIGYRFKNKHRIELGWVYENYFGGLTLPSLMINLGYRKKDHLDAVNIENSDNYSIRYGYALGKHKLKVIPSCAYTLLKSSPYINGGFPFNQIFDTQLSDAEGKIYDIRFQASDILHVDYGLRPYGHTINGQLELEYNMNKYLAVNIAGGYTHGFNTMGYYNVKYKITGYPEQHAINAVKGTHYYYSFGLKLYPFANRKGKEEKK